MAIVRELNSWTAIGKSIRGANHVRLGQPNQDAIFWSLPEKDPVQIIMALSDGHGGSKSFRSGVGASFAVHLATTIVRDSLSTLPELATRNDVQEMMCKKTALKIETIWKQAVTWHISRLPFDFKTEDTLDFNPLHPYGTTLIVVAITDQFAIFLQLGDGDILIVSQDKIIDRPFPNDPRILANETTSLCSPNACADFRIAVRDLEGQHIGLILVATDGYSNSFCENHDFLKAGSDFFSILQSEGAPFIDKRLEIWLTETTDKGSGDDITLGLIYPHQSVNMVDEL